MECARIVFVLFGLFCVGLTALIEVIRVDGDDFVSYNMSSIAWLRYIKKHTIAIEFKTVHPDGILIYIGSEHELNDFLMLDLVHGKLRITVNLGDNIPTSQSGDLVVNDTLTDNIWHTVKLSLEGRQLNATMHGKTSQVLLKGKHARLDIKGFMYVGGLTKHIRNILRRYKPSPNFKGCLRAVFYDRYRVNILEGWTKKETGKTKRYTEYGSPEHNDCQHVRFKTLSFERPKAFLKIHSKGRLQVNVKMRFRTYFADGVLVSKGMSVGLGQSVSVSLIKGKVFMKVRMSVGGQVIQFSRGKRLNDGNWHSLSVVVNETVMCLKVDQLPKLAHHNPELKQAVPVNRNTHYLFIGYAPHLPNFLGCIHDLRVDDKAVDLARSWEYRFGKLRNRCNLVSNCFPNPCMHCGKCNANRTSSFSCDCNNTFYRGRLCEKPIYQRTCQEYKNLGLAEDAYCKVDPDDEGPVGPFKVLCNTTDQNYTVAVVNHNKPGPQRVSSAELYRAIGYFHRIKYSIKMEEISALIAESEWCRQFVNFKCFGSKLMSGTAQVRWQGGPFLVFDHWPGAPAGSYKCACGVNGTCADPKLPCNCDIGDETWREDEGYITEKSNLPITVLRFLPSTAQSNFTVGPLECFGSLTDHSNASEETQEIQRQATRFFYTLCNVLNPTTQQPGRPGVRTPDSTPMFWNVPFYATLPDEKSSGVGGTPTEIATTVVSTSQTSAVDTNVPFVTSNEEIETATDTPPTTTTRPVVQFSTETINPELTLNNTQALGGSNGDPDTVAEGEYSDEPMAVQFTWQLVVTVVLLAVVSIMFVTAIGYFVKKQRRREIGCGLFPSKKEKKRSLAEVYAGFPEVKLRSRSGELQLPDRRSIEAGSYNVRTGIIAYGDRI